MPKTTKQDNWTQAELDVCVKAYLEMLSKEKSGIPVTKADYRKLVLAGPLSNRSEGAYEYRMQNISYVLSALGQQFIVGYRPARNVGTHTFDLISRSLERNGFVQLKDFEPTLDADELQQRAKRIKKGIDLRKSPAGQKMPKRVEATITVFYRDPAVRAWILKNAQGKCEACEAEAPFLLPDGEPFLEVHHVIPLAAGGPDTPQNALALCPNCHRRAHLSKDKDTFNEEIYCKVPRLSDLVLRKFPAQLANPNLLSDTD